MTSAMARRPLSRARLRAGAGAGAIAVVLAGCAGTPSPASTSPAPSAASPAPSASASPSASATAASTSPAACVSSTVDALSQEQRLGQLLMVGFDTNAALDSLDDLVADEHVGNVIYLGGWEGAQKVTRTSTHLQGLVSPEATGGVGLLIAADQEGGEVHQLRGDGFTRPPTASKQAQMDPAELTRAATTWAKELKAAGVNVNLAPVTDTVPKEIGRANQPIGRWGRQYGSTPESVSRSATAFLQGMLDGGIEGTVKHFPGLGRVRNNTDFSSTGITDSVATKDDPFLQPFADGIEAGAGLVMMASARYPKLDDENPAMFSEKIVTGLLREQLGYEGVVITDDVNAEALKDVSPGDRAVRHIAAGGDIVLTGAASDAEVMLDALAAEAGSDAGFAATVDASVERVLALKERMGLLPCSTSKP
ncbi:MAG TPA: glycoside hydrolase family 3 N-terminal domain-containing protein [Ornithinibacter sp.]|nr:glycoside hydrolase family 3 N-terminal domain-containing protein [Ornithinibacter sp.]